MASPLIILLDVDFINCKNVSNEIALAFDFGIELGSASNTFHLQVSEKGFTIPYGRLSKYVNSVGVILLLQFFYFHYDYIQLL